MSVIDLGVALILGHIAQLGLAIAAALIIGPRWLIWRQITRYAYSRSHRNPHRVRAADTWSTWRSAYRNLTPQQTLLIATWYALTLTPQLWFTLQPHGLEAGLAISLAGILSRAPVTVWLYRRGYQSAAWRLVSESVTDAKTADARARPKGFIAVVYPSVYG